VTRVLAIALAVLFSTATGWTAEPDDGYRNILDSIIVGVLAHDLREGHADGVDPNLELRFALPLKVTEDIQILPTVGGTVNFNQGADTLYLGATLQYQHESGLYAEGFFGLAGHTADVPEDPNEGDLGCEVLFRESAELGYAWGQHRVGAIVAHYSTGDILCSAKRNDGLTQFGMRYGYQF